MLIAQFFWQSDRLQQVLEYVSTVHDLCAVLGIDFYSTVTEVHPSLNDSTGVQSKSISNDTLSRLDQTVLALEEDKKQRLHKVFFILNAHWEKKKYMSIHELSFEYFCCSFKSRQHS